MDAVDALLAALERRRAELGATATGHALVEEFLTLARIAIDGYLSLASGEDVVRVEANSGPDLHAINLKRQLTWLDSDNDPGFTHIYLDMSFQRRSEDQALNWFTINYGDGPAVRDDVDVDAVARALREHEQLQRILTRVPQTVHTWIDGDRPGDRERPLDMP